MKKLVSLLLVLALVFGAFVPAFAATQEDAVAKLQEMNIVTGYANGDLALDQNITRAEYAAIAVRMLGLEDLAAMSDYATGFGDVPAGQWYTGYVNVAAGKGIVNGYGNGSFGPSNQVTFAEAVTMMVRLVGGTVEGGTWPENYLAKGAELGLLKDAPVANVQAPANRGTVFTLAYNALRVAETTKPVITRAKGLVVENNRVESLNSDELVIELMEDFDNEEMELEAGDEFAYDVKSNEDVEFLLGKVVYLGFTGEKLTSIEVCDDYKYLVGDLSDVDNDELYIDGDRYTITKDERNTTAADRRFYQAYVDNKDVTLNTFAKQADYDYAKVTVKNGKVLFVDAFNLEDVAPVVKGEDEKYVTVYDDQRDGRTKKLNLEDAFVFELKNGELYRSELTAVEADDVIHYNDDEVVFVRKDAKMEGTYDKVRTYKVDGDRSTYIYMDGEKYRVQTDNYKSANDNAVYSYDGEKFNELTTDFDDELEKFEDRNIEMLLDMNDNVQLVRSDFKDPRFFALVSDILAKDVELIGADSEKSEYAVKFSSDLYTFDYDFKVDSDDNNNDDLQDLYDSNYNDIDNGLKEREIDDFDRQDLVYVEADEDAVISEMAKIDLTGNFVAGDLKADYFKTAAGTKVFVDDETIVFYIEGSKLKAYSVSDFRADYKDPVTAAVVIAEKEDDLAAVVVVNDATSEDDDTDTMVVMVDDLDARGSDRFMDATDDEEKEYYLEASGTVKTDINNSTIEEGQVIEVTYTDDDEIDDAIDYTLLIDENDEVNVYKVLDIESSRELVLGFAEDTDEDVDDFSNDHKQEVYMKRSAAEFGDVEVGAFVRIAVNSDDDIIAIKVVDEPDDLADVAPIGANTTALQAEIDTVEALTEADYTAATWAALETALNMAKDVVEDEDATQEEINEALEELEEAREALEEKPEAAANVKVTTLAFGPSTIFTVTVNSVDGVDADMASLEDQAAVAFGTEMTATSTTGEVTLHLYDGATEVGTIELTEEGTSDLTITLK